MFIFFTFYQKRSYLKAAMQFLYMAINNLVKPFITCIWTHYYFTHLILPVKAKSFKHINETSDSACRNDANLKSKQLNIF